MIPPLPAGCPSWDAWHDLFREQHGRAPFLDEFAAAAMAVALGQPDPAPMTDEELDACGERNAKP